MKIVTHEAFYDEVKTPQDEIILNGPPGKLRGRMHLFNQAEETVLVRSLPLRRAEKGAPPLAVERLDLDCTLTTGERRVCDLRMSLPADTWPGEYGAYLAIGGEERTLRVIVQPKLRMSLSPTSFHLVGLEPGTEHEVQVTLHNLGNVPVVVPILRHHAVLDVDLICRNTVVALRGSPNEGVEATLDRFVRGVREDLAGWVETRLKEAGQLVPPGESTLLHVSLVLPKDVKPDRMYSGGIRILNRVLRYTIAAAPRQGSRATMSK